MYTKLEMSELWIIVVSTSHQNELDIYSGNKFVSTYAAWIKAQEFNLVKEEAQLSLVLHAKEAFMTIRETVAL